ncbi:MAG: FHA domain-containing protein [Chloroflexaceae bacterium]|nr:FHA domain-containing protein [Chloroflexaceae bacterium]
MSNHPWLSCPDAEGQPTRWLLSEVQHVLGRQPPADILLPFPAVSRQHARLVRQGRGYLLSDLESRNGTFLNGQPVGGEPQRLNHGDSIVLGGSVTLHFHDPGATVEAPRLGRLSGIWLDEGTRAAYVDGRMVEPALSAAQFALLRLLCQREGEVVRRDEIIAAVWPDEHPGGISEEAVDGLIKRLRARLRETQPAADYLQAVRGIGLKLVQPEP